MDFKVSTTVVASECHTKTDDVPSTVVTCNVYKACLALHN